MRQKSALLFAASWLVVRLRIALLSTQAMMQNLWQKPGIILVASSQKTYPEDFWLWDGTQLHFMHLKSNETDLSVRSFEMSSN
jgi:hypothetical protein